MDELTCDCQHHRIMRHILHMGLTPLVMFNSMAEVYDNSLHRSNAQVEDGHVAQRQQERPQSEQPEAGSSHYAQ